MAPASIHTGAHPKFEEGVQATQEAIRQHAENAGDEKEGTFILFVDDHPSVEIHLAADSNLVMLERDTCRALLGVIPPSVGPCHENSESSYTLAEQADDMKSVRNRIETDQDLLLKLAMLESRIRQENRS